MTAAAEAMKAADKTSAKEEYQRLLLLSASADQCPLTGPDVAALVDASATLGLHPAMVEADRSLLAKVRRAHERIEAASQPARDAEAALQKLRAQEQELLAKLRPVQSAIVAHESTTAALTKAKQTLLDAQRLAQQSGRLTVQ